MRYLFFSTLFAFLTLSSCNSPSKNHYQPQNIFSVKGGKTFLNDEEILLRGLRLSNALISDKAADELIANLDTFTYYGINSFSVYLQGSRFADIKGYKEDCSIDTTYGRRLSKIIEASDRKGFVVLVGCLYYGTSKASWESWGQAEANLSVANTIRWLKDHNYRNVFIDVDNEGMALKARNFDNRLLVLAGKAVDSSYVIATNFYGDPPAEADMAIHHSNRFTGKPYAETEGSPPGIKGGYWGAYSKQGNQWHNGPDLYQYINIGVYTDSMKTAQIKASFEHFDRGEGYFLASTWLQCVPPAGPNHRPGGFGSIDDPGIRWWLVRIKERFGSSIEQEYDIPSR